MMKNFFKELREKKKQKMEVEPPPIKPVNRF
jgi:hypothetical protein